VHFVDLKNDFVFRRIFGAHPDILRGLLNDLLDRHDEDAIASIEYLPSEQLPLAAGAKLSILDVRCRDRSGVTFIVEMQLLHLSGFLNRIVYNACKAYVDPLKAGEAYSDLADVIAISICDFILWPDAEQEAAGRPRVPMLSRWVTTEQTSGTPGLQQVQYAFLELPKLPERQPETGVELWAWLFVHTKEMEEMPANLPEPQREAVELANEASFTPLEMEAYRRVLDEIQQAREYGDAREAEGRAEGEARGKAAAVLAVLAARGIEVDEETRARIAACTDGATLDRWIVRAATTSSAAALTSP
jgi:predicted transposase/invertase (TIGR01784 family)